MSDTPLVRTTQWFTSWPTLLVGGAFVVALLAHPLASLRKVRMLVDTLAYRIASKDYSFKALEQAPRGVSSVSDLGDDVERRTLIFIRHGESTWNDTFNRSKNPIYFVPRLVKAVLFELFLLVSGHGEDSWFYDSPLGDLGFDQAERLRQFLARAESSDDELIQILRGEHPTRRSVVVSSVLRRCLSTAIVSLYDRLQRTKERVVVLPALQEISKNPDTLSITAAYSAPQPSWVDKRHDQYDVSAILSSHFDVSRHGGNKPLSEVGGERLQAFAQFVFSNEASSVDTIIVSGHSHWFRYFFQAYLPYASTHEAKKQKIANGGAVALDLVRSSSATGRVTMIDPSSVRSLFVGFDNGQKKSA